MADTAFSPPMSHETEPRYDTVKVVGSPYQTHTHGQRPTKNALNIIFRFLAFAMSLGAFLAMILSKQTVAIPVPLGVVTYDITETAEWQYDRTFVFFLIVSGSACVYSAITFLFAVIVCARRSYPAALGWTFFISDLAMSFLLLGACAALASTSLIGKYGNKHTLWAPICDKFPHFCDKVLVAMAAGALSFASLASVTIVDVYNLYRIGGQF